MANKVLSKRAVAHVVEHAESDGVLSFNLMNFTAVEPFDALHKAMARVQELLPTKELVWRYNADSAVWSAFLLEYEMRSGNRVRIARPQPQEPKEGF